MAAWVLPSTIVIVPPPPGSRSFLAAVARWLAPAAWIVRLPPTAPTAVTTAGGSAAALVLDVQQISEAPSHRSVQYLLFVFPLLARELITCGAPAKKV